MAKSEQQRQKKLAKKRSNEIRKRQETAREKQLLTSLAGQMQAASGGEMRACYISDAIFQHGMGTVIIGRAAGNQVAMVFFLVDAYCLGVKDAGSKMLSPGEFRDAVAGFLVREPLRAVTPATARKLVEGAIAFAGSYGLPPHPDYRKVAPIWGDIDPSESEEEFSFGRDGRPLYVPGPFDDPARQRAIVEQIAAVQASDGSRRLPQPDGDEELLSETTGGPEE